MTPRDRFLIILALGATLLLIVMLDDLVTALAYRRVIDADKAPAWPIPKIVAGSHIVLDEAPASP